jgi:outer membrane protein TolC
MNIPSSTKIILSDSLAVPSKEIIASKDSAILDNLSKFRQLSLEKQGLLLQEKKQQQSVLPVVNLIGNYSQQYLNMAFNYNYTDGKWWSPYSYVGLQIALPITKQFTNTSSIKKLSLRNSQLSFRIQQEKANVSFEINKSLTTLNNAYQRLQRTQENYGFAQKVYDNQKQQLQLGNLSYDTLLNTELSMSTAERNYISAVHEYLIGKLTLDSLTEQL